MTRISGRTASFGNQATVGRANVGKDESGNGRRQDRAPRQAQPPRITPGRIGRPDDAGAFVGAEQRRRRLARVHDEQRGNLDQSAAADHRVDRAGKKGRDDQHQEAGIDGLHLLADAEAAENDAEQVVGAEFSGDFAERLLGQAKFLGKQFQGR